MIQEKLEDEKYFVFSLNSQIYYQGDGDDNVINLEIPKGNWKECCIQEGFIVVRIPEGYQLSQLPTSFQLVCFQGTSQYYTDGNNSPTNIVGVFFIDSRTAIPLAGATDLFSFGYKLMSKVKIQNISNNMQIAIVGRVIDATFPNVTDLFSDKMYRSGLYYVNLKWFAVKCYFALYLKMKLK